MAATVSPSDGVPVSANPPVNTDGSSSVVNDRRCQCSASPVKNGISGVCVSVTPSVELR